MLVTVGELSRSEGVSLQPGERDGTREENVVTKTTGTNLRVLFEVDFAHETRRAGDDNVHSRRGVGEEAIEEVVDVDQAWSREDIEGMFKRG